MNQVEFLGLAQTFATVSRSNVQNFNAKPAQKRYGYSSRDKKIFIVVREVLRNNYGSRNLIGPYHFWGISPTSFTRPFLVRRRAWAGHETRVPLQ